jgi:cytochrome c553
MTSRILIAALALAMLSTAALAQDAAAPVADAAAPAAQAVPAAAPATAESPLAAVAKANPGDAKAGADKSAACAACHGMDGNSSDPQYPKIAGQHELYIARQLARFKSGERVNAIMQPFTLALTAQDMRDIAAHFATQKVVPGLGDETAISDPLSPYKGKRIVDVGRDIYRGGVALNGVPACMSCHGPTGAGNPGPSYPSLGGQHAGYTGTLLNGFKATPAGSAALNDANYAIMAVIAKRLSDEEILAVSSYIEGLHARNADAVAQAKP